MSKNLYRTMDIFDGGSSKYFEKCVKQATKVGLEVCPGVYDDQLVLELRGWKSEFIRYYIRTIFHRELPMRNGLKRLIEAIFW